MDLNVLESFLSIVEEGSMARAADTLHISQSALSSSIGKLERELGAPLFDRSGKNLQLTREGEFFLTWARRFEGALDEGRRQLERAVTTSGYIRIGNCVENDGIYYMISAFCQQYPQIQVRLYDEKAVWKDYQSSRLDFFVIPEENAGDLPHIRLARRHSFYVLMGSGHRLASRPVLRLEDLKEERFVFTAAEDGRMDPMYRYCKEQGFTPRVSFLCEGLACMLDLLVQTGAVTLAYNTFRQFRNTMDGVVAVPLDCDPPGSMDIALAWKEKAASPLADLFRDFAQEFMRNYRREA